VCVYTRDDTTRGRGRISVGILIFSQEHEENGERKKIEENKFDQVIDYVKPLAIL